MIELLLIYKWTIIVGSIAAVSLSLYGAQIVARDKSMQTLCIGQGAMLGVLCGIGLSANFHMDEGSMFYEFSPPLLAILVSLFVGKYGLWLEKTNKATPASWFIALFSLLLALNYLVSALFPGLESHMTQVFFGDLATLSSTDVTISGILSALMLALLVSSWKQTSNRSFEQAILSQTKRAIDRASLTDLVGFIFVCFSIQYHGFLFTIALLFIPTILMSLGTPSGLKSHLTRVAYSSFIATALGFISSLVYANLPTVPSIVVTLVGVSILFLALDSFSKKKA